VVVFSIMQNVCIWAEMEPIQFIQDWLDIQLTTGRRSSEDTWLLIFRMSLQMLLEMDDSDTLHADTRRNAIH
jgi:hypothetical protein